MGPVSPASTTPVYGGHPEWGRLCGVALPAPSLEPRPGTQGSKPSIRVEPRGAAGGPKAVQITFSFSGGSGSLGSCSGAGGLSLTLDTVLPMGASGPSRQEQSTKTLHSMRRVGPSSPLALVT